MTQLLYVSVKVNSNVDCLTQRIAGQVDCGRTHVGPIEALAGHARPGAAVVGARCSPLAYAYHIALHDQRDPAWTFAPRHQRKLATLPFNSPTGRAIDVALPEHDQPSAKAIALTCNAKAVPALPSKSTRHDRRFGRLLRTGGKQDGQRQDASHCATLLQLGDRWKATNARRATISAQTLGDSHETC